MNIEIIGNLLSIILVAAAGPAIIALLAFNKGNL
jgi:hypothetical protein